MKLHAHSSAVLVSAVIFAGLCAAPHSALAALSYVGSAEASGLDVAYNIDLSSLSLQEGDLVIVTNGYSGNGNGNPGVTTAGYAEVADLFASELKEANFSVNWKLMGAVPDTSVTCRGSDNDNNGSACQAYVWRGADTTTPMDVTPATDTGLESSLFDSPSITPVTAGAVVISLGLSTAASGNGDAAITAPAGYSNQVNMRAVGDFESCQTGIASKAWSGSGAEDPGAWSNIATNSFDSWAAVTLAIRPAPEPPAPTGRIVRLKGSMRLVGGVRFGGTSPVTTYGGGGSPSCDAAFTDIGGGQCRLFVTSLAATTFSVPSNWTSTNTIETIGGGGGGSNYPTGGGGGAYSASSNITLTPGATVGLKVGQGGAGGPTGGSFTVGGTGGDTYICNSTSNCASIGDGAVVVGAKGGGGGATTAVLTSGGASGSGVGSTKVSGGSSPAPVSNGSGGGGAGGPLGAGAAGGQSAGSSGGGGGGGNGGGSAGENAGVDEGSNDGGAGGNNFGGTGGGTAGSYNVAGTAGTNGGGGGGGGRAFSEDNIVGGAGGAGTEWDASHGSGGGGGGGGGTSSAGVTGIFGGAGGLYGGGGGAGGYNTSDGIGFKGGDGGQGIIVITYTL